MAAATVRLPRLLEPITGGVRTVRVDGATIAQALESLLAQYPALRVHLFDETGRLRRHVTCWHNDVNVRWLDSLEHPIVNGDELTIMQAVSGG